MKRISGLAPIACTCALLTNASAIEIRFGSEPGEASAEEVLRHVLRVKADAVLEASYEPGSFVVARTWSGGFEPGDRLTFARCEPIRRGASAARHLEDLLLRTPVLDVGLSADHRARVADIASADELPLPRPGARVVLAIWQRTGEHRWGFPRQTIGDMLLVQDGDVYVFAYGRVDGGVRGFWVRFAPAPSYESLEALLQEILAGTE